MDQKKTKIEINWFVRILVIILCLFIVTMICFNFFGPSSFAQISTGLLVLIAFLTVLVLSESFDNFSILKLMSISKKVEEKEKENTDLKTENSELRNQIISISANISQKQSNSTFIFSGDKPAVKEAEEFERQEKQKEDEQDENTDVAQKPQETRERRYISAKKCEEIALPKFLSKEGLSQLPIMLDAKIINQFQQTDPISEFCPIFDAYINTIDKEIFIKMNRYPRSIMFRDRL